MPDLDTLLSIGFSSEQSEALLREIERTKDVYALPGDPGTSASRQDQIHVLAYALNVFGDPGRCVHWLCKKWDKLGGAAPVSLLKSRQGTMKLYHALIQIDYGFSA